MSTATSIEVFPPVIAEGVRHSMGNCLGSILGKAPVEKAPDGHEAVGPGIVSMISMVGEPSWTLALAIQEATAVAIVEKFTGFPIPFDTPDMGDVIGELANVLGGDIVAWLDGRKVKSQLSLPMVARGSNVEVMLPQGSPSMQLVYTTAEGVIWVKLACARPGHTPGRRPGT